MLIGVAADMCCSAMALPQAWLCIRSRRGDGVSPLTWYLVIANAGLWILWGMTTSQVSPRSSPCLPVRSSWFALT